MDNCLLGWSSSEVHHCERTRCVVCSLWLNATTP
jgi:hypothetical protein